MPIPSEPRLRLSEIQGNVLPGLNKDYQAFVFGKIDDIVRARTFLRRMVDVVTSASAVLQFRQLRHVAALRAGSADAAAGPTWLNIGFTVQGLRKLRSDADAFVDRGFVEGLASRAGMLGDSLDPADPGAPANWLLGGPSSVPDVMFLLAQDREDLLGQEVSGLTNQLAQSGLTLMRVERGSRVPPPGGNQEPFGYHDGISEPGVRGTISDDPDSWLTARSASNDPNHGLPGQDLIWPGEFVFGYQQQEQWRAFLPGPESSGGPDWTRDGSLMVFLRLRQDVPGFVVLVEDIARQLASVPDLASLSPQAFAARMIGRWASGAPVSRVPDEDVAALGESNCCNNNFAFTVPASMPMPGQSTCTDTFPAAPADLLGLRCPFAAHVRKANPRDEGSELSQRHRILRRGIPFESPMPDPGEKGLLFVAYQASLERQFEFIMGQWLRSPSSPVPDGGVDILMGNASPQRPASFILNVPKTDGGYFPVRATVTRRLVTNTGGVYLFAPSISALRLLTS